MKFPKIPDLLIPQKYPRKEMGGKMDYKETGELGSMHAAIEREKAEPSHPVQGAEPIPAWLLVLFIITVFWAGGYLLLFSGGFRGDVVDEMSTTTSMYSRTGGVADGAPEAAAAGEEDLVAFGRRTYMQYCVACHQKEGQGSGQWPPLAGSEWVLEGDKRLALIILHGIQGPITVRGQQYGAIAMPPWGGQLNDKRMAAVMTYIRQEWGNSAPPVSVEGVAEVRQQYADRRQPWTAVELDGVAPAGVMLTAAATEATPETEAQEEQAAPPE